MNPKPPLTGPELNSVICLQENVKPVCSLIVRAEAVLIRLCWLQEVGCGFVAVSQEVADCITGGTDGGKGGEVEEMDYGTIGSALDGGVK